MRTSHEIAERVDNLSTLPVSEEMIGAYLEGTLSDEEASAVGRAIGMDADLVELMGDVSMDVPVYDIDDLPELDSIHLPMMGEGDTVIDTEVDFAAEIVDDDIVVIDAADDYDVATIMPGDSDMSAFDIADDAATAADFFDL